MPAVAAGALPGAARAGNPFRCSGTVCSHLHAVAPYAADPILRRGPTEPGGFAQLFDRTAADYDRDRARHGVRQRFLVPAPRLGARRAGSRACGCWTSAPAPGLTAREAARSWGPPGRSIGRRPECRHDGARQGALGRAARARHRRGDSRAGRRRRISSPWAMRCATSRTCPWRCASSASPGARRAACACWRSHHPRARCRARLLKAYMRGVVPLMARCMAATATCRS